jgi:hypothetical protein
MAEMKPSWVVFSKGVASRDRGDRWGAVLSTGPLATDPEVQQSVGVLVENNLSRRAVAMIRLFNGDVCPKAMTVDTAVSLDPGCAAGIAFPIPGFFYEAQVGLPRRRGVLVSVYGLTADFKPIAANTLHMRDLVPL